jgi:hypothetical protein
MLKVELLVVKDETLELEAATGVEIIVDDTPAIILSCFDPVQRIARLALHKLVTDGRFTCSY